MVWLLNERRKSEVILKNGTKFGINTSSGQAEELMFINCSSFNYRIVMYDIYVYLFSFSSPLLLGLPFFIQSTVLYLSPPLV